MVRGCFLIFFCLLFGLRSFAQEIANIPLETEDPSGLKADKKPLPLWEYGLGVGYFQYEHYPASNQYSWMVLPFPTFQYRGEVVRADDRDGARAYMLKESNWSIDFSGGLLPGQNYASDSARAGMPALPWMVELGPQLVWDISKSFQFRGNLFQAISSDFTTTKTNGIYYEPRFLYKWSTPAKMFGYQGYWSGNVAVSLHGASAEFLGTYFDVSSTYATPTRPTYSSSAGLLAYEGSFFQAFSTGRFSFYAGGSSVNYDISVNRGSPLDKSDHNYTYFMGITYTFAESPQKSVPPRETEGVLNLYYDKMR